MTQLLYAAAYQLAVVLFALAAFAALPRGPARARLGFVLVLAYIGGMFFGAHALYYLVAEGTLANDGAAGLWSWLAEQGPGALALPGELLGQLMSSSGGLWGGPLVVLAILGGFLAGARMPDGHKAALGDAAAVALPLALALCKLGCFAVGCCHGVEGEGLLYITDTWSSDDGSARTCFPTQLLDAASYLAVGAVVLQMKRRGAQRGRLLLWFTLLFCAVRFVSEMTRGDERASLAGLSATQLVLVAGAAAVLLLLARPALWQRLLGWRTGETRGVAFPSGRYVAYAVVGTVLWLPLALFLPLFGALAVAAALRRDAVALAHRGACAALGAMWLASYMIPSLVPFIVLAPLAMMAVVAAFDRAA